MSDAGVRLGGFEVRRRGQAIAIGTPTGSTNVRAIPFLLGVKHLLVMGLDLEGEAELEGGLVFRVQGERIRLRLGSHSEDFPKPAAEHFFMDLLILGDDQLGTIS